MTVIDGPTIIDKNYVTFPSDSVFDTEEQIQPNGVDLRVEEVKLVSGRAQLPREGRIVGTEVQIAQVAAKDGWFDLHSLNGNYLVEFAESISVPDGFCATIITRSSLVRVGMDVITGLWDTGFQGRLGASVRLRNPVQIQVGARLAQVMFHASEFNGLRYAGSYHGSSQSEFK